MVEIYKGPVFYKKNSKGNIEDAQLTVEQEELVEIVKVLNSPDVKQRVYRSVIKPKKTKTAKDVAVTQARHKETLMKRKGWCLTKEEAEKGQFVFKSMELHRYDKCKAKVKFPCGISPKLKGVKCTYNKDNQQLTSRGSKQYINPAVQQSLKDFPLDLEGELYIHGMEEQDIVSLVKNGSSEPILWVFDMPTREPMAYKDRMLTLKTDYPAVFNELLTNIKIIPVYDCYCHEDIERYHEQFVREGYEGSVIRNLEGVYEWNGRSYDVLKWKPVYDSEFKIVDCVPDPLSTGGDGIAFICENDVSRDTFKCTPKWDHDERREKWERYCDPVDPYDPVKEDLKVEYRGRAKSGIPIHGVGISVRDYE
jgi:DNA ligase-1